ncbi:MAG: DUF1214 domain-containing protein [Alphaproteobacteria bacterium]|nr:DUF1214 domain-containing protein [Alphaproteobacteria bacterium]
MFGAPTPEEARQRVIDGTSWEEFCELLKAAGSVLQRPGSPDDAFTRAEGVRYLTRLTRAALQAFVEHNDPMAPVLQRMVHETAKMGADNPDNYYENAAVDGRQTYRLHGTRGTVHYLELATQKGSYGQSRGMPPTGHLDARDMLVGADGRVEIVLSCDDPGPGVNWLPMEPDTGTLIVRQSRLDPATETLARLTLERVGGDGRPTPLDAERIDAGLRQAGMLVGGAAMIFADWAEGFTRHVNRLPRFDPATSNAMGGVPEIAYYHSYWRLAADEALVITAVPPPCDHWNFQLNNHWMESLDYRYDRIHVNSKTAAYEPDGSLRIVVAHDDPGHPNWIRTVGHTQGTMCFRWVRPEGPGEPPEPTCAVVRLDAIRP